MPWIRWPVRCERRAWMYPWCASVCNQWCRRGSAASRKIRYANATARALMRRSRIECERWASPWGFLKATCVLRRSFTSPLGPLLLRIDRLRHAIDEADGRDASAKDHLHRLSLVFVEVAGRQFGIHMPVADDVANFRDLLDEKLETLAHEHGSPSPAKCARLEQIARLSMEFSQVLRSPRSNYTAFLARRLLHRGGYVRRRR